MNEELKEDDGFALIIEIVQIARAGKEYRPLLKEIKPYVEMFPKVADMLRRIVVSS